MAANTKQVSRSFVIAGFTCLLVGITVMWLAVLLISSKPDLKPDTLLDHLLSDYAVVGLKGLILTGIMAMVMSTADSYINSTAVLVVHDFCVPLGMKGKNELIIARMASVVIGGLAICLAMKEGGLLKLLIFSNLFYMPLVTVPFIMTLLGFRSSGKSVLIGMAGGFVGVVVWEIFFKTNLIDGLIPGMVANLICLLGAHYLLRQPGGWVGIRDNSALNQTRYDRKIWWKKAIKTIINFNIGEICRNNGPKTDGMTVYLGVFSIISIYSTMHVIPKEVQTIYTDITRFIYGTVLFMATGLLSYPLWLQSWREGNAINIYWSLCVFYILICSSFMLVLVSGFSVAPIVAFAANLIVVAALLKWQWGIFLMGFGMWITCAIFKWDVGIDSINIAEGYEFKITYVLVVVSSILVMFFKPKQEDQELAWEKVDHLTDRINDYRDELYRATELKYEFLRNLEHEAHTPITGITSMAQAIAFAYDKLPEAKRKQAVEDIAANSEKLESYVNNLIDLSKLSSLKYELDIKRTNLSELIGAKIGRCKKFYIAEQNKNNKEIVANIEPGIFASCDQYYIGRTLENIIVNSIQYCRKGGGGDRFKENQRWYSLCGKR